LVLPPIKGTHISSVYLLNDKKLKFDKKKSKITIRLPKEPIDKINTVLVLELDKEASTIQPLDVPENTMRGIGNANFKLKTMFSQKYAADGVSTLFDEQRGSTNFSDRKWLGFEEVDLNVVIDLKTVKDINKVSIGCLQNQDSWIFFPKTVKVLVSDDGTNFKSAGAMDGGALKRDGDVKSQNFKVSFTKLKARYFQIIAENIATCPDWHKGAGGKAWIVADEIIIQ